MLHASGQDQELTNWFEAAHSGNIRVIKNLLKKIDVNAKDTKYGSVGYTALIHSAAEGHIDIVKLLLQIPGIDVNAQSQTEETALIRTIINANTVFNNREIVKLLLKVPGINVNVHNYYYGSTALTCAAKYGLEEIVLLLLEIPNIKIHAEDSYGKTAYMLATEANYSDVALAIKKKAQQLNNIAFNAIDTLAKSSSLAIGSNPDMTKEIEHNNLALLKKIIDQVGEKIVDADGNTLLHKAFAYNLKTVAVLLLQNSYQPDRLFDIKNNNGQRPLDMTNPTSDLFRLCLDLAFAQESEPISISDESAHKNNCSECSKAECTLTCSSCKKVYYCGSECQKKHWKTHKQICKT